MRRTPALAFLLVTVFIDMLGLGIVVPIAPALMTSITGHAGSAARWAGAVDASFAVMLFLTAPLLGRLADRYGRRPILVTALAVLSIMFAVHGLARAPWQILLVHAAAGAFAASGTVVNAYVADITPPQGRPKAFGYVGAAMGFGIVIGPVIGGLLGGIDIRLPFYVTAGLAGLNALYGAAILPESRPGDRTTSLHWRLANPVTSLVDLLRRAPLRPLIVARTLSDLARVINQAIWVFAMMARFSWSTTYIGVVLGISAVVGAFVQARLSAPFIAALGVRRAAVVCAVAGTVSLGGYALVPDGWYIILPLVAGSIASIGNTAVQSWVADLTGDDEQGAVQGALSSITSLAEIVATVAATAAFAWSLTIHLPGFTLLIGAALALGSAFVLARASDRGTPHPAVRIPARR